MRAHGHKERMRLRACDREGLAHRHINVVIQGTKTFDFCIAVELLVKVIRWDCDHSKAGVAVGVVEFLQIGILFGEGALRRGVHDEVGFSLPLARIDTSAIDRWEAIGRKLAGVAQARRYSRTSRSDDKYRGPEKECVFAYHKGSTHHAPI